MRIAFGYLPMNVYIAKRGGRSGLNRFTDNGINHLDDRIDGNLAAGNVTTCPQLGTCSRDWLGRCCQCG